MKRNSGTSDFLQRMQKMFERNQAGNRRFDVLIIREAYTYWTVHINLQISISVGSLRCYESMLVWFDRMGSPVTQYTAWVHR